MLKNDFTKAMQFRHACKLFDETKQIPDETMRYILEAGRTSPSSFGMEPWKFLVIRNEEMKTKLRPLCWNQPQITTCSDLVVILAAIESVRPQSGIPEKRFARRPLPQEQIDAYVDLYGNFLADTLSTDEKTFCWTARQTYIALANMMTAAAYEQIDSCPIEGFEKENVEKLLGIDSSKYQVAVMAAFGYRVNEQSEQLRLPFEEIVEFID
ncbi:NAD(P)H-flavin nitroreductase [Sulfurovum lithotrophicum]|uniref:NAD(P)H-flavin nitroreductase n=1 Tax=Sulfurovum lithotrophicum TaxID=206403 RepID=A0A7U4RQX3_9BACT|nr:NAD(P)H-dependent oxidoreductase [Sulfurovum lithotrophicum]AKF25146.1 NAD(P)H-flavin nitroreductase [Sulfurovum lithotrophicum]